MEKGVQRGEEELCGRSILFENPLSRGRPRKGDRTAVVALVSSFSGQPEQAKGCIFCLFVCLFEAQVVRKRRNYGRF